MASTIVMPKQGNTVESCIIVEWLKDVGDEIVEGDIICVVETDKATLEVESAEAGTILALFYDEGEDVPVLSPIAAVGSVGDDIANLDPKSTGSTEIDDIDEKADRSQNGPLVTPSKQQLDAIVSDSADEQFISPRAKKLAEIRSVDYSMLKGSGPGGRIIERDIESVNIRPKLTPVAKRMVKAGDFSAPSTGTGTGGRVTSKDLVHDSSVSFSTDSSEEVIHEEPIGGIRKVIAERMLNSLQSTAQLTLNSSADARSLLSLRKKLKSSPEKMDLSQVTIGDLVLFAVSRTLPDFSELNAIFDGDSVHQFGVVHLALAVDTPRGLMVPVIRRADTLSLRQLSEEARRLAVACQEKTVKPDELKGGTFTVSNLGAFGVESFTPILNPPQVGILGVGNINLKPVEEKGELQFIPHIGLSLTINHQVIDGAPAARFLRALVANLAELEILLAK